MKLSKPKIIVLCFLGVFLLAIIFQWKEFVQGLKEGFNSSDSTPSGKPAENPTIEKKLLKSKTDLQLYNGQVFQIQKPRNWVVNETRNGIDVFEPSSSGALVVSGAILLGAVGQSDPFQYADWLMNVLGLNIQKVVQQKSLPSIPGALGTQWQRGLKEYIILKDQQQLHVLLSVALCNGWGQYSVITTSMTAPESQWKEWAVTLCQMGESFKIINGGAVGGVREMASNLPKNNPLDSSSIMSSWEYKNRSEDRNSQNWQEAMMGYERGQSTSTGQLYDMPLNSYDPTAGGYRNPENPNEVLNTNYDSES